MECGGIAIVCKPLHSGGEREPVVGERALWERLVTFLFGDKREQGVLNGDKAERWCMQVRGTITGSLCISQYFLYHIMEH